jgi:hypothetical protein
LKIRNSNILKVAEEGCEKGYIFTRMRADNEVDKWVGRYELKDFRKLECMIRNLSQETRVAKLFSITF